MINTRSICANSPKEPFTINNNNDAIALCNTDTVTVLNIVHDKRTRRSVEFLEIGSRRKRIAIKHIKNVIFSQINKSLITAH